MSGLFTVIIAEKEHIDAIRQKNKLFFEPFLESKNLAFCEWNPMGQTLSEAVPGLQAEVYGEQQRGDLSRGKGQRPPQTEDRRPCVIVYLWVS